VSSDELILNVQQGVQPKNANTFRHSFDRPSLYSASEQAMNSVAVGLSGATGITTTGSSWN
jgi:hypothetical protein